MSTHFKSSSKLISCWPTESDWNNVLADTLQSPEFQVLDQFVSDEYQKSEIYPPLEQIFQAFRLTSFRQTRVVILGQDPYHGVGQAHGLSFSVPVGIPLPPSLKNIFRELATDVGIDPPQSGDLTGWAKQGVLLLNTVLTVRANQANSHANQGWEFFTDQVIQALGSRTDRQIIFLLWGKPAERKRKWIKSQHEILTAPHPSPLSAHRGFFGSQPFSKMNRILEAWDEPAIKW